MSPQAGYTAEDKSMRSKVKQCTETQDNNSSLENKDAQRCQAISKNLRIIFKYRSENSPLPQQQNYHRRGGRSRDICNCMRQSSDTTLTSIGTSVSVAEALSSFSGSDDSPCSLALAPSSTFTPSSMYLPSNRNRVDRRKASVSSSPHCYQANISFASRD